MRLYGNKARLKTGKRKKEYRKDFVSFGNGIERNRNSIADISGIVINIVIDSLDVFNFHVFFSDIKAVCRTDFRSNN